jgi:tetratricopeptide (TPR) repeat protein
MNRSGRGAIYSVALIALVGGLVLAGAMAINLMTTGSAAFPVTVFGDPRTSDKVVALSAIRPAERAALPQGRIDPAQLLPMPIALPPWEFVPRTSGDSLYARAAGVGLARELDRAREAAQVGDRDRSLKIYAEIGRKLPGDRALLQERASVLASFGEHAQATALLRSALERFPGDYGLRMLAAHNAWWSNQPILADSLVGAALVVKPAGREAAALRDTIRSTTQPPLTVARAWARATNAAREHLLLARALVREGAYGEALASYRVALADRRLRSDSLLLEAGSAAMGADSLAALEAFTDDYLVLHPADTAAVLRLARAYSWRADYPNSLRHYRRLDWSDPSLRLEVAQVLLWSGQEREAERELRAVNAAMPRDATALKLLGDLALWRADWNAASTYYAQAYEIDPMLAGLHEGLTAAAYGREQARLAALPRRIPDGFGATFEGFADNQRFRWVTTRASRALDARDVRINASVQQSVFEGAPAGPVSRNPAAGLRLDAAINLWQQRARLDVLLGADSYASVQSFAVFGGGLTVFDLAGAQIGLDFNHQPAAQRAATMAALQARATSDVLGVSVATTRGKWSSAVRAEAERFASSVGGANRTVANASVSRILTPALSATASVSGQRVDRASPVLPGFGSIIWAPSSYVEPAVGMAYRTSIGPGLSASAGAQAGYGFVRERAGNERYGTGSVPTAMLTADLLYSRGQWTVGAGGSYGGALTRGYRAAVVRAQASYRLGR